MDLIDISTALVKANNRLSNASKETLRLAKNRAETERDYRKSLSVEIMRLRADGMQATLIPDVARGNINELKFERDLAMELHRSALSSMQALTVEISAWQSLYKQHNEV